MGIERRDFQGGQLYGDLPLMEGRIERAKEMEEVFKSLEGQVPVVFRPKDGVFPIKFYPTNFSFSSGEKKQ